MRVGWMLALVLSAVLPGCGDGAIAPSMDPALATLDRTARPNIVTYKTVGDESLVAHVFLPSDWNPNDRRTAWVWLHGGGFIVGGPEDGHAVAGAMAARGIVGISAQYRLSVPRVPGPKVDGSIADARSILRWVRAHSSQLGVEPDQIVASGHSAGAFLMAAAAVLDRWDDDPSSRVSASADALVLWSAPILLDRMFLATVLPEGVSLQDVVPSFHVRPGVAPSVLIHGADDELVSPSASIDFAAALVAEGNQSEVRLIPGADHFFLEPRHQHALLEATFDALASLGF